MGVATSGESAGEVTLFWQPGCTSCLRTKEFLLRHGVAFASVNVHDDAAGREALLALGARSVPVVARDGRFVFGQVLEDVASFLGIAVAARRLPPAALVARLDRVLAVAASGTRQLPEASLETTLPGRDLTYRELAHHIFRIGEAFLEVAGGAALTPERVNQGPPPTLRSAAALASFGNDLRRSIAAWWAAEADPLCAREVETYFGRKPLHLVLERTTWHSAQHTRQLAMVLERLGIAPEERLRPEDLAGLPLPENVWDVAGA